MPDEKTLDIQEFPTHLLFRVHVLPKSSQNKITGTHKGALKIKLTAPPVEGEANKLCIEFLSKWLKVPRSNLSLVAGHTGRKKRIRFQPATEGEAQTDIRRVKMRLLGFDSTRKTP